MNIRLNIINFLKQHPCVLSAFRKIAKEALSFCGLFIPKSKKIIFASFGGRKFDDSPRAIYEEICKRREFDDWEIVWAFVEPDQFDISRGAKVKIDTPAFFKELLSSRIWVSNTGIDRGIGIKCKDIIRVETWHGTPIKKICGEENANVVKNPTVKKQNKNLDGNTIRCAQSQYDREIFARVFQAKEEAIMLCDLPRNDVLLKYTAQDECDIKTKLHIPANKRVILYMPTYREYLMAENEFYIAPPIDFDKWKEMLGNEYVVLFRAHYAVSKALNIQENEFLIDVSNWSTLNELYCVADILISDYSSAYVDFSILERPMLCFAYDYEEYNEKRGMYIQIDKELPCPICKDEDEMLKLIKDIDYEEYANKSRIFKEKYAPFAGNATKSVVDKIEANLIGVKNN